jgi:hypothetical protein
VYPDNVREIDFGTVSIASTGDKFFWSPGKMPHILRWASVVATVAGSSTGVVRGDKRPTAGSDTSRGSGDLFTINIPNPLAQGKGIYKENLNVRVDPGQEAVITVGTLVTGCTAHIVLGVEQITERPANIAALTATT